MRLYEITHELIEAQHDEVNTDSLDQLQMAFDEKVAACAAVTKNLRAESDAIDAELKRLQQRKAAVDNNRKRLIDYIKSQMEAIGLTKVDNGIHSIRIQKSPLKVEVLSLDRVPMEYKQQVIDYIVDKKAIAAHIKETGEIPTGVDAVQNTHLRIN